MIDLLIRVVLLILKGSTAETAVTEISNRHQVNFQDLWDAVPDNWKH